MRLALPLLVPPAPPAPYPNTLTLLSVSYTGIWEILNCSQHHCLPYGKTPPLNGIFATPIEVLGVKQQSSLNDHNLQCFLNQTNSMHGREYIYIPLSFDF